MKEGLVGKPLSLHCNVKGSPKPLVRWMRWGSRVTSSQSIEVLSNGTLLIGSFSANEEGDFECHAQNSFGRTSTKVYVKSIGESYFFGVFQTFLCSEVKDNIRTYFLLFAHSAFLNKRNNNFLSFAHGTHANSFVD